MIIWRTFFRMKTTEYWHCFEWIFYKVSRMITTQHLIIRSYTETVTKQPQFGKWYSLVFFLNKIYRSSFPKSQWILCRNRIIQCCDWRPGDAVKTLVLHWPCRGCWHPGLSPWQPTVPPVAAWPAAWRISVFSGLITDSYSHDCAV